ncbi:hypothetical protein [Bartonella sp. AC134YNZD]
MRRWEEARTTFTRPRTVEIENQYGGMFGREKDHSIEQAVVSADQIK